jgi:type II secretory pathway pseudopilin PulG
MFIIQNDRHQQKKYVFCQKGSIMMQVLVSILILSMGLAGSLSVIVSAIESNTKNEQRMIAMNLAQEGIEAMRSIRDTNWLTYSSNLRECWNFWEDTNEDGVITGLDTFCTPNSFGQNDHPWSSSLNGKILERYIVDFDHTNFRWKLISEDRFSSINTDPDYRNRFRLFITSLGGSEFYTHNRTGSTKTSLFSREINLYYIDTNEVNGFDDSKNPIEGGAWPESLTASPNIETASDNRILVISRVFWVHKGKEHEIIMSTFLTDFLDRHEWDS